MTLPTLRRPRFTRPGVPGFLVALAAFLLTGCGSTDEIRNLGAEERFALGKSLYDRGEYLEAITELEIVKLQYPGSAVADDAQFYMGESRFNRGEFLLAVEEYRTLKRSFASSPLLAAAQYKTGMSYYHLAPRPELDQTYTRQAIDEFQALTEYYPLDEHRSEAEEKIRELNGRLAEKLFDSAEQYVKLGYHRSAGVYYDLVIQQYHDSPYAEPAHVGKIRTLVSRNRFEEARSEISQFLERYPQSPLRGEVEGILSGLPEGRVPGAVPGPSAGGR